MILNNRFVSAEELVEHVGAADIYITPYRQEAQVVSGTLAIALGAGKAIISTPYWHAKELLAEKRGVIVPFDDPDADCGSGCSHCWKTMRSAMPCASAPICTRAEQLGRRPRGPTWRAFSAHASSARCSRRRRATRKMQSLELVDPMDDLPVLNTGHLSAMTDDTGMLQHAIFSVPNTREGYTTDDNARALIVSTLLDESATDTRRGGASQTSRAATWHFLWLAFHSDTGRFRNFLGYDRNWLEDVGSEDSHGRALWALGSVLGHSRDAGLRGAAGRLFEAAVPAVLTFTSPRAWAFSILGLQAYLDWFPGDRAIQGARNTLANRLLDIYERSRYGNLALV